MVITRSFLFFCEIFLLEVFLFLRDFPVASKGDAGETSQSC